MLAAAIFDWEGVVVDSAAAHEESWERLAKNENRPLPPGHFALSFGRTNREIFPEILQWTADPAEIERLSEIKEALYREVVVERGLDLITGARDLIMTLQTAGVPLAVGSSTPRRNLDVALPLLGLGECFQAIVAMEDVRQGKPHPEVFLTAAKRLGAEPTSCVVFEDAPAGLTAAKACGMYAVGFTTSHPADKLSQADLTLANPGEVVLSTLRERMALRYTPPTST